MNPNTIGIEPSVLVLGALNVLTLVVIGIVGFYGARLQRKVDELSANALTRQELTAMEIKTDAQREIRHRENLERLSRIEGKVESSSEFVTKVKIMWDEIERIREWRHTKVDAYIPAAVDGLKLRVDRVGDRRGIKAR